MNRSATVQAAFGLFDDDSSDEEQVLEQQDAPHHARHPVTDPLVAPQSPVAAISTDLTAQTLQDSPETDQTKALSNDPTSASTTRSLYAPWDDVKPQYIGPIDLVTNYSTIGGQRGYVAQRDLEPGTLLMIEQVYVPWPTCTARSEASFFIKTMEKILKEPSWRTIMQHLSVLFPQSLDDLPRSVLEEGQAKYLPQLRKLASKYQAHGVTEQEMLQNVFAMQCNAFESGVFLYNAMFNHDCNPNCVKFTPSDQPHERPRTHKAANQNTIDGREHEASFGGAKRGVSEVRVARRVLKGEPLTISYLYPREQSREVRQETLSRQFGFDCECALCERGDSVIPHVKPEPEPSAAASQEEADEHSPKPLMRDLEVYLSTAEDLLRDQPEEAASALGIALETLSDALEIVSHDHVVLIRLHKLVADCCGTLLQGHESHAHAQDEEAMVTRNNMRDYALLFLRSNVELLELQRAYLNVDHIDLARTLNDLSQGIQVLLALDPQVLLEEFPEWQSFRQASIVENSFRKDYLRIKKLYE